MTAALFQPLDLRGLRLKNRLVVSPMVHYSCAPGHMCGAFHMAHLGRYALGGFGLTFVEATAVEAVGLLNERDLGIWTDAQAESFRPLVDLFHSQGAAIGIQLAHGGRKASAHTAMDGGAPITEAEEQAGAMRWQAVGPTDEPPAPGWPAPRRLSVEDCQAQAAVWADAARRAVAAGFDAIEIHAAHGYLLASFLSPISNTREDAYGGDLDGRMRMTLEVAAAVREAMPATIPLFVRVSSVDGAVGGWSLDDTVVLARRLKALGADVIDCSSGGMAGPTTAAQVPRSPGFQVPFAERVRADAAVATMAVGLILAAEQAERIVADGQADLVAIGRQAQFNPNLAHHWAYELGVDPRFQAWPRPHGWWLEKRIMTIESFATPTGEFLDGGPEGEHA